MATKEDHMKAFELYGKDRKQQFSPEEKEFLISYIKEKRNEYIGKYCIYNKHSYKNAYVQFTIDQNAHASRRSAVENAYTVICTRPLCDIELEEMAENWGTHTRRFVTWNYRDIESLIEDDLKYDIQTPEKFIAECRKRGYTSGKEIKKPKPGGTQLTIFDLLNE